MVEFKENPGRFGLGYKPTCAGVRRNALKRRGRSMGQQQAPQVKGAPLYHINESFVSVGWMCEGQIAMIHDEVSQEPSDWVWPCPPEFKLGNWQIIEQPRISVVNIM